MRRCETVGSGRWAVDDERRALDGCVVVLVQWLAHLDDDLVVLYSVVRHMVIECANGRLKQHCEDYHRDRHEDSNLVGVHGVLRCTGGVDRVGGVGGVGGVGQLVGLVGLVGNAVPRFVRSSISDLDVVFPIQRKNVFDCGRWLESKSREWWTAVQSGSR